MVLSSSENSGNSLKEVTSLMSGYEGQLKDARFAKEM